ncbi:GxxExxY protein [Candidatus Gottesmanbacteria bacterium]|nr:GxxExxY protein [Candidatus Gottesmanbacteria bacterium]
MDLVYPELSYKLVGHAFRVYNDLGYGYPEKYYQQAYAKLLSENKINFEKEKYIKLPYLDEQVGKYFLDFIVDNKIVIELKVRPTLGYTNVKQVMGYLKSGKYKLAILIYFTREGIKYRRIVNLA